ncbi:DUF2080 family transposase-associated protein [Thermoplasma volcanium]|uniref:DUF2080 family transposase-associated protein n=1 Tax=Thermoplasma volcanium TaxID=50339 RepID=UPI0000164E1F|nr:DUF2080 family transposase-associated protein [Thermoplasma volcanium]
MYWLVRKSALCIRYLSITFGFKPYFFRFSIRDQDLIIREKVETVYKKTVTLFGNSGKVDVPKRYIGKRVYVIVPKE